MCEQVRLLWLRSVRRAQGSGLDLSDPRLVSNLRALAELAKMQLSDNPEVVLRWAAA